MIFVERCREKSGKRLATALGFGINTHGRVWGTCIT